MAEFSGIIEILKIKKCHRIEGHLQFCWEPYTQTVLQHYLNISPEHWPFLTCSAKNYEVGQFSLRYLKALQVLDNTVAVKMSYIVRHIITATLSQHILNRTKNQDKCKKNCSCHGDQLWKLEIVA